MLKIFAGISLFQGAVFGFVGFILLGNVKKVALQSGIVATHPFFEAFRMEETFVYVVVLGGTLLTMGIFTWLGMMYSHEAVGAIYRLKKDIEKMTTTKKLFQVKLRQNDYFKDFEETFNEMVVTIGPHMDFDSDLDEFTPTPTAYITNKKDFT